MSSLSCLGDFTTLKPPRTDFASKFKDSFSFRPATELQYVYDYMKQRLEFVDSFFTGESLSAGKWLK